MLSNLFFLLTGGTTVDLSGVGEATAATADAAADAASSGAADAALTGGGLFGIFGTVGYIVVIFGAMYFLMIRPQRKRDKQMREMRSQLRVGDNVVTSSGMYGKIVDVGGDVFIIEFGINKGIRIPIAKNDVIGVKDPKLTQTDFVEEKK